MAQPTNTFSSYDAVGIREDLSDVIDMISPEETPFYTRCKKVKASNTLHEWQTDTLRPSTVNAHVEGDDTTAEARQPTTRLSNRTQIFKNAVVIPDTDEGLTLAGRAREMAYQITKVAKEQKLDLEKALFDNQAAVGGDDSTARRLAGLGAWIKTNTDFGATGSDPTALGTDERNDGTQRAFVQSQFDTVMQSIWESGGKPDTCYLSPFQMNAALGFVGNNNQRSQISAEGGKVSNYAAIYLTPWGEIRWQMSREMRPRDVYILQSDKWEIGVLRPMKNTQLAKTGDNTKRQVVCEKTLCAKNEQSSGGIFDLTTS